MDIEKLMLNIRQRRDRCKVQMFLINVSTGSQRWLKKKKLGCNFGQDCKQRSLLLLFTVVTNDFALEKKKPRE
jgi:hypothetical protein